jgi:hypothetical protein
MTTEAGRTSLRLDEEGGSLRKLRHCDAELVDGSSHLRAAAQALLESRWVLGRPLRLLRSAGSRLHDGRKVPAEDERERVRDEDIAEVSLM